MPQADPPAAPTADPIAALVGGTYVDGATGETLGAPARGIVIADSLAGRAAELVAALGLGPRLAVVADEDTHAALGERVARELAAAPGFSVDVVVLPSGVHADATALATLLGRIDPAVNAVVAVGSGTINDLGKLAALDRDVPQVVFATAPSMNGYTSVSASIVIGGIKRSIRAATPVGAFFDLGVLAAAPARLVRAGLGDSVCRPTAQADWLLSHLLLDRPYREAPFALLVDDERELLARADALLAGDLVAMRHLVRTLVLSGFGMTICGGSYPASQGEHLLAHYVEMMAPELRATLHGEQIGVCAVAMARLQDEVLARAEPPRLRASAITRDAVLAHFGPDRGAACWRELEPKLFDAARATALTARLELAWPQIRARLAAVTLGAPRIEAILRAAGAPTTPAEIGWSDELFTAALAHARAIRDRYTFLDLVADLDS
jgi:glycerol-1-phosphate dehydrogenase [NAD(P)+]